MPPRHGCGCPGDIHTCLRCHRAIHRTLTNTELARGFATADALRAQPELARFIAWVADKPPDFHAPTRRPKH